MKGMQIMSNEQTQWAAKYKEVSENPPKVGVILSTFSKRPVKLTAELKQGAPPFIFARATVPDLFGESLGWYLRDVDDRSYHGWRAVLLPRARSEIIQKIGLGEINADSTESVILVKSLRLIRYSSSGQSMLCEVHAYCDDKITDDKMECDETVAKTPPDEAVRDHSGKLLRDTQLVSPDPSGEKVSMAEDVDAAVDEMVENF